MLCELKDDDWKRTSFSFSDFRNGLDVIPTGWNLESVDNGFGFGSAWMLFILTSVSIDASEESEVLKSMFNPKFKRVFNLGESLVSALRFGNDALHDYWDNPPSRHKK